MTIKPLIQGFPGAALVGRNLDPAPRLTGDVLTFESAGPAHVAIPQGRKRKRGALTVAKVAPSEPRAPGPIDVTADFTDLAPEDRVYRDPSGYLVKVKAILSDDTSRHGAEIFELSGSIVGADGKALLRHDGQLAVHSLSRKHHQLAHAMSDPVVGLEVQRLACVTETVTAERHHQLLKAATDNRAGVVTASAQTARKAAEAKAKAKAKKA